MRFLLSGEGPTDLGKCNYPQTDGCSGKDFTPGPMARILDVLVEEETGRSFLDDGDFEYLSRRSLDDPCLRPNRKVLTGLKRVQETGLYFLNAYALGAHACAARKESDGPVVAVLFRDADGNRAARRSQRKDKVASIADGFKAAGCEFGIPMVPRPTCEAWLLCALEKNYQGCAKLEALSGSDKTPKPLKKRLEQRLGGKDDAQAQADLVRDRVVDPTKIDMPSYNEFRFALHEALLRCK